MRVETKEDYLKPIFVPRALIIHLETELDQQVFMDFLKYSRYQSVDKWRKHGCVEDCTGMLNKINDKL